MFKITKEEDWRHQSACAKADNNIFFPLKITAASVKQALTYCKTCPVKIECAQTAVIYDYDGIWGGTTTAQRNYFLKNQFKGSYDKFTYNDAAHMLTSVNFVSVAVRSKKRKRTKIPNEG